MSIEALKEKVTLILEELTEDFHHYHKKMENSCGALQG